MKFKAWTRTEIAARPTNDDSFLADRANGIFVVADGVGSTAGGSAASQTVVDRIQDHGAALAQLVRQGNPCEDISFRKKVFDELLRILQSVNREIFDRSSELKLRMATTADIVVLGEDAAFIAHVGDSRVYLIRDDTIFRITEDHTFAEYLRSQDDAAHHDTAPDYEHVLMRSIGSGPLVEIDALFIDLRPGDRLIVCSDGLTAHLGGQELLEFALSHSERDFVDTTVNAMMDRARDNVTLVYVELEEEEQEGRPNIVDYDMVKQLELLARIKLFDQLDLQELIKVLRIVRRSYYRSNDVVIECGDSTQTLFVIAKGTVELEIAGTSLLALGEGEHFGELALVEEEPRSATARCLEDCVILAIPAEQFRVLIQEDSALGRKLLWNLLQNAAHHLRRMTEYVATSSAGSFEEETEA